MFDSNGNVRRNYPLVTKPHFEIARLRSFGQMNSQGSRIEKNTHAQRVQMQKKLCLQTRLAGEICLSDVIMHEGHSINTS